MERVLPEICGILSNLAEYLPVEDRYRTCDARPCRMRTETPQAVDQVSHVGEDDAPNRAATASILRAAGHSVRVSASAVQFLSDRPDGPGCLILDLWRPEESSLDVQDRLVSMDNGLPVVFVTGSGDVPTTARAMKAGA